MNNRLYVIEIVSKDGTAKLRFNNFSDFATAYDTISETVDGFEEGNTKIITYREEENPV